MDAELHDRIDALEADMASKTQMILVLQEEQTRAARERCDITTALKHMTDTLDDIKEILSAFRSAKGFVTTIKFIGGVAAALAAIGAAFAAWRTWGN